MKRVIILLILCQSFNLKADINEIPKRDLAVIESLFESLVIDYNFGYTLFGMKPMSLTDMRLKMPTVLPIHKYISARFMYSQWQTRFKTWYKYRSEFKFKNFILLDNEKDDPYSFPFILINKTTMLPLLQQYIHLFKEELGESFEPNSFLEKIEKKELSVIQAIGGSHRLLGLMLGYGERNATLFAQRIQLLRELRIADNAETQNDLTQRLREIETQLGDFSDFEEEPTIPPLYFLADLSHPETVTLKQKYAKDRTLITELIKQPKFKDRVLKTLLD